MVNKQRAAVGLGLATMSHEVTAAADRYAQYMATANFFSHYGPDGSTPSSRIAASGYRATTWGENIAAGQRDPASVMQGWMNSPGHRATILNASFREIGV